MRRLGYAEIEVMLMQKIAVEFSEQQLEQLVDRLPQAVKLRLAQKLDRQTRQARWAPLVTKLRQRFAQRPLSAREIRRVCETVRQEHFERTHRR